MRRTPGTRNLHDVLSPNGSSRLSLESACWQWTTAAAGPSQGFERTLVLCRQERLWLRHPFPRDSLLPQVARSAWSSFPLRPREPAELLGLSKPGRSWSRGPGRFTREFCVTRTVTVQGDSGTLPVSRVRKPSPGDRHPLQQMLTLKNWDVARPSCSPTARSAGSRKERAGSV